MHAYLGPQPDLIQDQVEETTAAPSMLEMGSYLKWCSALLAYLAP